MLLAGLGWLGVLLCVVGVALYHAGNWRRVGSHRLLEQLQLHPARGDVCNRVAAVLKPSVPLDFTVLVRVWVLAVFLLVEVLRVARRVSGIGWRECVLSYHVSPLHTFTVYLQASLLPGPFLRDVYHTIVSIGQCRYRGARCRGRPVRLRMFHDHVVFSPPGEGN